MDLAHRLPAYPFRLTDGGRITGVPVGIVDDPALGHCVRLLVPAGQDAVRDVDADGHVLVELARIRLADGQAALLDGADRVTGALDLAHGGNGAARVGQTLIAAGLAERRIPRMRLTEFGSALQRRRAYDRYAAAAARIGHPVAYRHPRRAAPGSPGTGRKYIASCGCGRFDCVADTLQQRRELVAKHLADVLSNTPSRSFATPREGSRRMKSVEPQRKQAP